MSGAREDGGGGLSRRELLRLGLAGGTLCVGLGFVNALGCGGARKRRIEHARKTGEFKANMYITVAPSGRILLAINKAEIGQGVSTGYATLVAEELEVEVADVDCYFADSLPEYRTSGLEGVPLFRSHLTGGSTSMREAYIPLRKAAAAAREMLLAAAAREWGVKASECQARDGRVVHQASGKELGYGELAERAARESAPDKPRIKRPGEFRLIGKRTQRVDARAKVTGQAVFGIDVKVPDMVRALVIHGPTYGARPRAVHADAARAVPGVIDIFPFEWGVAVVADKYWQALRAARDVTVEWHPGKTAGLSTDELAAAARSHRASGTTMRSEGDARGALNKAGTRALEAVYEAPYLAHAPMEPQNCTVLVRRGSAEVWAPTQVPNAVQEAVSDATGISTDDVLVHTTFAGGGFGRRGVSDFVVQAALIARRVKRPVQMIWSRESDMRQGYYRPAATTFMRGAIDDQRKARALSYHSLSQPIGPHQIHGARGGQPRWLPAFNRKITANALAGLFSSGTNPDWFATEGASDTPYRIANMHFAYSPMHTGVPVGFWRSVGHSFNAFAMEGFIDEMAHAADRDPYEFRREILAPGSRELRVLDAVAEMSGWNKSEPAPGFARGIARQTSFDTECAQVAEVGVVDGRIRVRKVWCAVECGVVVNPDMVAAQMEGAIVFGLSAALDQEITMVDGVVQEDNYDGYPLLRMFECPEIEVRVMASEEDPTGVGEPGLPPVAPAVANALFVQTGVRLRRMPLQRAWEERATENEPGQEPGQESGEENAT